MNKLGFWGIIKYSVRKKEKGKETNSESFSFSEGLGQKSFFLSMGFGEVFF